MLDEKTTPKGVTKADLDKALREYKDRKAAGFPPRGVTEADLGKARRKYQVRGALREIMQDDDFLLDSRAESLMDALWERGLIDAADSKMFTSRQAEVKKRKEAKGFPDVPPYAPAKPPAEKGFLADAVDFVKGAGEGLNDKYLAGAAVAGDPRTTGVPQERAVYRERQEKARSILSNDGQPLSAGEVFGRSAGDALMPGLSGLAAGGGMEAMASMLPISNPLLRGGVRFGANLLGNVLGAKGGSVAQNALDDAMLGTEVAAAGREALAQGAQEHPWAARAGTVVGQMAGQKPLNVFKPAALAARGNKTAAKQLAKQQALGAGTGAAITATLGNIERGGKTAPEEFLWDVISGGLLAGDTNRLGKAVHKAGRGSAETLASIALPKKARRAAAINQVMGEMVDQGAFREPAPTQFVRPMPFDEVRRLGQTPDVSRTGYPGEQEITTPVDTRGLPPVSPLEFAADPAGLTGENGILNNLGVIPPRVPPPPPQPEITQRGPSSIIAEGPQPIPIRRKIGPGTPPTPVTGNQVPDISPVGKPEEIPATPTEEPVAPPVEPDKPAFVTNEAGDRSWAVTDRDTLSVALRDAFNIPEAEANANADLFDRFATNWAEREAGRTKDQFYKERLNSIAKPGRELAEQIAAEDKANNTSRRASYERALGVVIALNNPSGVHATHELGHAFLEGHSPAEQDAYLASIGSKRGRHGEVPVEAHEKFVASFLEWMRNGEAETGADAASAPLFKQFKGFLQSVYDNVVKWVYRNRNGNVVTGKALPFNPEVAKTLQGYLKANDGTTKEPAGPIGGPDLGDSGTGTGGAEGTGPIGKPGEGIIQKDPIGAGDGTGGGRPTPTPETPSPRRGPVEVDLDTSRPIPDVASDVLRDSGLEVDADSAIDGNPDPRWGIGTKRGLIERAVKMGRDRVQRSVGQKDKENDPGVPDEYQHFSQYDLVNYHPGDNVVFVSPRRSLKSSQQFSGLQFRRRGKAWQETEVGWRDAPDEPGVQVPIYRVDLRNGHSSAPDEYFHLYANKGEEYRFVVPGQPDDVRLTDAAEVQTYKNGNERRGPVTADGMNVLLQKNEVHVGGSPASPYRVISKHTHNARQLINRDHGNANVPEPPPDILYSQEPTTEHTVSVQNPNTNRKHNVKLKLTETERKGLEDATAKREAANKAISDAVAAKSALPADASDEAKAAASKAVSRARAQYRSASASEAVAVANAIAASKSRARRNSGNALKAVNEQRAKAKMDAEDADRKAKGLPPLVRPKPGQTRKVEIDPDATPRKIPPTVIDYTKEARKIAPVSVDPTATPRKVAPWEFDPSLPKKKVPLTEVDPSLGTKKVAKRIIDKTLPPIITNKAPRKTVVDPTLPDVEVKVGKRTYRYDPTKPDVTISIGKRVFKIDPAKGTQVIEVARRKYVVNEAAKGTLTIEVAKRNYVVDPTKKAIEITIAPRKVTVDKSLKPIEVTMAPRVYTNAQGSQAQRDYQSVMDFAPDGWSDIEKQQIANEAKAASAGLTRNIGRFLFGSAKYAGDITKQTTASTDASGFRQISIIANPYRNQRVLLKAAVAATKAAMPDMRPWRVGRNVKKLGPDSLEKLQFGSKNMKAEIDAIKSDPLYKDFTEKLGYEVHEDDPQNAPGNEEMPGTTFVKHMPLMAMAERHFNTVKEVALFNYLKAHYNAMKAAQKHSPGSFPDERIWREMRGFMDTGEVTMGRGDMAVTIPHLKAFMDRPLDTMLPGSKASKANAKLSANIRAGVMSRPAFKVAVRAGLKMGDAFYEPLKSGAGPAPTPGLSSLDGMTLRDVFRFYSFERSLKNMVARERAAQAEAGAANATGGPAATPKYKGHDALSLAKALNAASDHDIMRVELPDDFRGAIGLLLRAPSWTASRWQLHNPNWVNSLPEHARREYIKDRIAHAGWVLTQIAATAAAMKLAGRIVDTNETFDPDSRRFLGMDVDDVHYNFGAAATQDIRLIAKVVKHLVNTPQAEQGLSHQEIAAKKAVRLRDDVTSYMRAKLSPLAGLPVTFIMGKNVVGEDAFRQHEALKNTAGIEANAELVGAISPMVANTILEAWTQGEKRKDAGEYPMGGWGYVLATMPTDFFGAAQTGVYPDTDSHGNPKRLKAIGEGRPPRPAPPSKFDQPVNAPKSIMEFLKGTPKP